MSATEAMMHEQLDRIIARAELRVRQQGHDAGKPGLHADDAKKPRNERERMLTGLARLKNMAKHIRPLVG